MEANSEFESVATVLQRIRFDRHVLEERMTAKFDKTLSMEIDAALLAEESESEHVVSEQELTA